MIALSSVLSVHFEIVTGFGVELNFRCGFLILASRSACW